MAANDVPLSLVLGRSLSEGALEEGDPDLQKHRLSASVRDKVPLSQSVSIYPHRASTIATSTNYSRRFKPHSTTLPRTQSLNTINGRSNTKGAYRDAPARSGYGLADFSSEEEGDEEEGGTSDEDGSDTSDSEEEMFPVAPHRSSVGGKVLKKLGSGRPMDPNSPAHYVTHLTGQMDPMEARMQKLREEGKELAPLIAEKVTAEFAALELKEPVKLPWIHEYADHAQKVRSIAQEIEAIKEKRMKEMEAANQAMTREIDECLKKIKEEREHAQRIRDEALRKAQAEKDRLAKEAEDKKKAAEDKQKALQAAQEKKAKDAAAASAKMAAEAAAAAADSSMNSSAAFVSEAGQAEWQQYKSVLDHIRTVVLPTVTSNPVMKKYCFAAKREITTTIGQLVNVQQGVLRAAMDIDKIFKLAMQQQGEHAYNWVMNFTAKKLVKQAETEALVKAAPAFPLAHLATLLFTNHAKFLDVVMARFAKKCPYVTPMYIAKEPNDTPDQFFEKLGYRKKGPGWETEAQYNERQCGMFTLYCAIVQTTTSGVQNMYPLSHGWTWMARILNMPPRPITPSLLATFLDVCGHLYLSTYRNQAVKVLKLLNQDFVPLIPRQGIAGKTRLMTILENFQKTGRIPVPEGREYERK